MSNINGASGGHYISNAEILAWMQEKTDGIYSKMGQAMDVSNDRADAEDALNTINSKIADVAAGKADANELYALMNGAIDKFGTEFPDLAQTLTPIANELHDKGARLPDGTDPEPIGIIPPPPPQATLTKAGPIPNPDYEKWAKQWGVLFAQHPELVIKPPPAKVTIEDATAKRWTESVKSRVDAFGKDDQLSLISIQEFNAQLNQAKQTASALMDASDKAANSIINHIS
jgi:hypothetical protein